MIPSGFDDLHVIPLRPGQAHYLNDFIREHKLDAPLGSTTTNVLIQENAPEIILQALLTFGDKTSEGRLIEAVRLPWYELVKIITRDPEELFKMDPRTFEELIAGAYDREGFRVELTPRSGDKGRDVVATKDGVGSIRIFDQVKLYKITHRVTADEVRALIGVISTAPNVSKGVFTTSSEFAPRLLHDENISRLVPHRLELKPREILIPWLDKVSKQ
jgi:restriction system protein